MSETSPNRQTCVFRGAYFPAIAEITWCFQTRIASVLVVLQDRSPCSKVPLCSKPLSYDTQMTLMHWSHIKTTPLKHGLSASTLAQRLCFCKKPQPIDQHAFCLGRIFLKLLKSLDVSKRALPGSAAPIRSIHSLWHRIEAALGRNKGRSVSNVLQGDVTITFLSVFIRRIHCWCECCACNARNNYFSSKTVHQLGCRNFYHGKLPKSPTRVMYNVHILTKFEYQKWGACFSVGVTFAVRKCQKETGLCSETLGRLFCCTWVVTVFLVQNSSVQSAGISTAENHGNPLRHLRELGCTC